MKPLDAGSLITAAAIIAATGTATLMFRLQREIQIMERCKEQNWLACADWLAIASMVAALITVVALALFGQASLVIRLASSLISAGAILFAGYPFAILAHYRLLFGKNREGPRENPEAAEKYIILAISLLALLLSAARSVFAQPNPSPLSIRTEQQQKSTNQAPTAQLSPSVRESALHNQAGNIDHQTTHSPEQSTCQRIGEILWEFNWSNWALVGAAIWAA
jgi:hypothetical protein